MTVSAVIPTKSRPADLRLAVRSLVAQSRRPAQIVIIDQSPDHASADAVRDELAGHGDITLTYVHDTTIAGLVAAKHASLAHATGDLICFFEDDVVLEPDYLEAMVTGFEQTSHMTGCSGIITNPPSDRPVYRFVYRLFHRGVFTDPRPDVYARVKDGRPGLIESNIINGGLSAWRRGVFASVPFDVANGFHMMEDAEFSTRVSQRHPGTLFINPGARLAHYPSPINRETALPRQHRKVMEYTMFYRKHVSPATHVWFGWLWIGIALEAVVQCAHHRSLDAIRGLFSGTRVGLSRPMVRDRDTSC